MSVESLQLTPYSAELVPEQEYPDVTPDSRRKLLTLIEQIDPALRLVDEPDYEAYKQASRSNIEDNLYVRAAKPIKAAHKELFISVGVPKLPTGRARKFQPSLFKGEDERNRRTFHVAFQPAERPIVARSPGDLADTAATQTWIKRFGGPDRQTDGDAAMRSSGHVLEEKISAMARLRDRLVQDSVMMRQLIRHLVEPAEHRMRVSSLDKKRAYAVEKVHETAELAAVRNELSNSVATGIHRVIKKRIYSGNYSSDERTFMLVDYLTMVGLHNHAKLYKIKVSTEASEAELKKYKPYLDKKAEESDQTRTET